MVKVNGLVIGVLHQQSGLLTLSKGYNMKATKETESSGCLTMISADTLKT